MKIIAPLSSALFALGVILASHAETPDQVKAELKKRFPDAPIESVRPTSYGLLEVTGGGEVYYTDDKASFLIVGGSLIDTKTRENLTEARQKQLSAVKFDSLPFDQAFKIVRCNGTRKIAMFADPNCGYCKRFERDLATIDNITVYMFMYPILSPESSDKAKNVWCSTDQGKAWLDLMLRDRAPAATAACQATPIDKNLAFGREKRIQGTPTIFFEDGERVPGAMPKDAFEKRLADAKLAVAKTAK